MKIVNRGISSLGRQVGLLLALLLIAIPSGALAANAASSTSPASASGLSISPLRQQLTLDPGQSQQIDVTLKNITGGTVVAHPTIRDFTSDGVDGNPKIITNPNQVSPASIKSFITNLSEITLTSGQQKTFTINVTIPSKGTPGAYYGLIEYQAVPVNSGASSGNSKVALTAAVSQLIFVTIPGNVTQLMQVNSINVYHNKQATSQGLFFTSPPKAVGISLENLANDFEQPYGTVQIQNLSGKVVYSYQVNNGITRGIVLPYTSRVFTNQIKNISTPGPYTVVASITYGKGGSAILVAKKTFWYIPMWLIVVVLIIILILIALVLLAYRRYKGGKAAKLNRS